MWLDNSNTFSLLCHLQKHKKMKAVGLTGFNEKKSASTFQTSAW